MNPAVATSRKTFIRVVEVGVPANGRIAVVVAW
jgi:hypothetical protein